MIALILLGFGAIAALATYEFSPSVHKWVDEHLVHAANADAANDATDAHVEAIAVDPAQAQQRLAAAAEANRIAAAATAAMAQTAKTPGQRAATIASSLEVMKRQLALAVLKRDRLLSGQDWVGSITAQDVATERANAEVTRLAVALAGMALRVPS